MLRERLSLFHIKHVSNFYTVSYILFLLSFLISWWCVSCLIILNIYDKFFDENFSLKFFHCFCSIHAKDLLNCHIKIITTKFYITITYFGNFLWSIIFSECLFLRTKGLGSERTNSFITSDGIVCYFTFSTYCISD